MSEDEQTRQRNEELLRALGARRQEAEARYRQALAQQLSGTAAGDSEGVHGWKASREGGADLEIMEALDRTLRQIDAALARLRAGRYGFCSSCSDPIPLARLRALPFATLCVPCQERREKGGR
ncbi:MAG TPA: TraR/DksA family transcriptional regulator [Candidatus Polarisedimenticolia bacterium]|nr:TraR/DksA family transcriptional regulator [Candidatus Polarisedimenticolia bacterium]